MEIDLSAQPFARLIGLRVVEAGKAKVVGRLTVREELCTSGHILHGGAYMAFADTLGAIAASLNLPPGAGTTTLESKTNFLGSARVGDTIIAETTPLHVGRRSSVWQTRVTNAEGRLLAMVTQTQLVLAP